MLPRDRRPQRIGRPRSPLAVFHACPAVDGQNSGEGLISMPMDIAGSVEAKEAIGL